jgi:hypothetical protein
MKKAIFGISALILTAFAVSTISGQVLAYQGDPNKQGPNCTPERHEVMEKAFDNKDYNAWKSLMQGKGRVTQVVNEGNFAKFVEAHNLAEAGKTAEAGKIRQELGLGLRNGSGNGQGMGMGRNNNK